MHINSGSLNETDKQRGLAHYLEHLAFNGSDNFPPGSVVPFFQSLGMTFGRDQNAFTSFEQTTYQLSLPDTKTETLHKGLQFFSDVLYRLALQPKEIDAERQIIQEERRRSLSGRQRTGFYVLEHIAPGSIFGQRIPIGTEESINGVTEEDFRNYYGKWYTASNATIIAVADADPADVVAAIKKEFEGAPKKDRPSPQDAKVTAYEKSFAIVTSDPEVQSEEIRLGRLEPARPPTTTVPQYRNDLVARLTLTAFNRRIDAKVAAGGTSYLDGSASMGNDSNAIYTAELGGRAAPGKWREALNELALEMQRAREFGFTPREVDDAKKQIVARAQRRVETEATEPAGRVIGRIGGAVASGEPVLSAEQEKKLIDEQLPGITVEEVGKRFAVELDPKAMVFIAVLPSGANVPSEAELVELGTKALAVKPERGEEKERAAQLLATLPTPGKMAEGSEHTASGVWSGWLANNVRLHHRFMDTQKNEVTVSIALLGGELAETAENRGITQAAELAWGRPTTKHLSSSDIRDLLTGKKVDVRGGGGGGGGRGGRGGRGGGDNSDAITLSVSGSPDDLETGMQLAYLLLTEPKIEATAFEQYVTRVRQTIEESQHNPLMLGMRLASGAPYPPDVARTQPLTLEQLDKLKIEAAQAWLENLIAKSPIEVTIVGDLPRERAVALAEQYLGSLPSRDRVSPALFADLRKLNRPVGPRAISRELATETPQAFVLSGFYGPDETNVPEVRAMTLATRILSTRMTKQVREEAQLVYSIGASSRPGTTYPGFGIVGAGAPTEPSKVKPLLDKLSSMYAEFAKEGPTADELDVAKKQIANTLDEEMRQPGFWMGRIARMTYRGVKLDDVVEAPAAYQALTAEAIRDVFAKYYKPEAVLSVSVQPEAATAHQAQPPASGTQ
jgi:zinc protease